MNIIAIFFIVIGLLFLALVALIIFAVIDWRGFFVRKFGPDISKGLAHIQLNGVWVYRESNLIYQGDDAISYVREVKTPDGPEYVTDIVPHKDSKGQQIPIDYDEYTGARVYRVEPGGTIGLPDRGSPPAVDYPARLVSAHVLDRTAARYAASVSSETPMNWKPLIFGGIAVVVIAGIILLLFINGVIKLPGTSQTTPDQPPAASDQVGPTDNISGPVGE